MYRLRFFLDFYVPIDLPGIKHDISEFTYYIRERAVDIQAYDSFNRTDEDHDKAMDLVFKLEE